MIDVDQQLANSKILVIDDEQIIIDVITAHLNVAGFWNVVGINDSIDAVTKLKSENPDLVLVDISMPDVSGNYLIQVARTDPILQNVPLLVVTASDSEETHQRAIELGADQVLIKPVHPTSLVEHVESALSRKLEKDASSQAERQARSKPEQEIYNELRGLGGRVS